jgi:hypothetical protein
MAPVGYSPSPVAGLPLPPQQSDYCDRDIKASKEDLYMDTTEGGTKGFSNNKVVGESALAPMDTDDGVKSASSSKPKKQKVAKRESQHRGKLRVKKNSSVDIAAATISHRLSRRAEMRGAAPASRNAIALSRRARIPGIPRRPRRPNAPARLRPPAS